MQSLINWLNRKNLVVFLLVCFSVTGIAGFFISSSVSAQSEQSQVGLRQSADAPTQNQTEPITAFLLKDFEPNSILLDTQNQTESIADLRPEIRWMRGGHTTSQAIDHAWDGNTMASMSASEVKLWRTSDNTLLRTIPKTSSAGRNRVSLSSNGQFLAFTDGDLTVRVYNVSTGALVRTFNENYQSSGAWWK